MKKKSNKKSGFATCVFCFAKTHGLKKLNLVASKISNEISYAIKRLETPWMGRGIMYYWLSKKENI